MAIQRREAECVISATEAKNRFGALIAQVAETGETVVVERQGRPRAAIVEIEEYRRLRGLDEEKRWQEAVERIRQLQTEISAGFSDLTEEQVDQLAQEIRDEAMAAVVEKHWGIPVDQQEK
jgi:prevent-host-death family protein